MQDLLMRDLDLARSMTGEPLSEDSRARLRAAVEHPGQASWDAAYTVLISPRLTLWQAVLVIDPSFGSVQAPVTGEVNDAVGCLHPEGARDFQGSGDCWSELCEECGSRRMVHPPDNCGVCLGGEGHVWAPNPEMTHLGRISGWSRTPDAGAIRQAIAFATH